MSDATDRQCCKRIHGHWVCPRKGILEHEGKWYCKTHHPPAVAAKKKARYEKWDREWTARRAAEQRRARHRDAAEEIAEKISVWDSFKPTLPPEIRDLLKTWRDSK